VIRIACRPDRHWLSVSFGVEEGTFTTRGEIDNTKAKGIWAFDVDSGESVELVQPETREN
jgi:hypothetical protein